MCSVASRFLASSSRRLLLEQRVDVWIAAIDVGATLGDECLEPCGGVAESAAGPLDEVLEPLLGEPLEESCPLERPQLGADAHGLKVIDHGLGEIGERAVTEIVAGIEAFGIARRGQQLPLPSPDHRWGSEGPSSTRNCLG